MCLLRLTMNTMHGPIQSRETVPLMVVHFFLYCKLYSVLTCTLYNVHQKPVLWSRFRQASRIILP
jgi:hypothetical protein